MIFVSIEDMVSGNQYTIPSNIKFTPTHYGDIATGGSDTAEVEAVGPLNDLIMLFSMLSKRLVISAESGTPVWHGLIEEVIIERGLARWGLSLRNMANRISVAYTVEDIDGNVNRETTAWAEDAESIARYGTKEAILSLSDTTAATAQQYRDTQLERRKYPAKIYDLNGAGDTEAKATIYCIGLINTLEWVHYQQLSGYLAHDVGTTGTQVLGVGTTSTRIGFSSDGKIHHLDSVLTALQTDNMVQVTGSASNNGAHVVTSTDSREPVTYTASTIFFDPSDDVNSSENALSFLDNNDYLEISGASNGVNNGIKLVTSTGAGHITVNPATIINESAGSSVTLQRGTFARTETEFTEEFPSNSVTLRVHGFRIMQSFTLASSGSWPVNTVSLRIRKYGSPSDDVTISIATVSGNAPGTVLESASITASEISSVTHTWRTWQFDNATTLAPGVNYCLWVYREGSASLANYYSVEVDTGVGYANGDLRYYTGSAWTDPYIDASLYFRIESAQTTTAQIQNIVSTCGQFFAGTEIFDASGVQTPQYRTGDLDGLSEFEKLLDIGTSANQRLFATVTPSRYLRIYQKPLASRIDHYIELDGSIMTSLGTRINEGRLIAGTWIRPREIPPSVGAFSDLGSIFVEASERNADGVLRPRAEEQQAVWDL